MGLIGCGYLWPVPPKGKRCRKLHCGSLPLHHPQSCSPSDFIFFSFISFPLSLPTWFLFFPFNSRLTFDGLNNCEKENTDTDKKNPLRKSFENLTSLNLARTNQTRRRLRHEPPLSICARATPNPIALPFYSRQPRFVWRQLSFFFPPKKTTFFSLFN